MIIDKIENYKLYPNLGNRINLALEYLLNTNFSDMVVGKYEIDKENVFAIFNDYTTKSIKLGKLEAHRQYIDVQYMVEGNELMGYAPLTNQIPTIDYDEKKDVAFFDNNASFIKFEKGMFGIFFPTDLHMPGIGKNSSQVKKIVVKVKI